MNFSQSSLCQAPSWLCFLRVRIDSRVGFTAQKTQYVQGRHRQIIQWKRVLLNWFGRLCSHFTISGHFVVYTNDQSTLEKQTYRCFCRPLIRFRWCNQPFSQPEDSLTMDREKGRESERKGGGRGWSGHQDWPCCYKNTFFHQPFYAKGEDQVLNQTSRLLFYFSSSPLPVLLRTNLLCAFPLSSHHSSPLLPSLYVIRLPSCLLHCLLSNWYESVTLGPSGVKWYKVIGRSSLLTGWPLKGLLEGANQVLLLPP